MRIGALCANILRNWCNDPRPRTRPHSGTAPRLTVPRSPTSSCACRPLTRALTSATWPTRRALKAAAPAAESPARIPASRRLPS